MTQIFTFPTGIVTDLNWKVGDVFVTSSAVSNDHVIKPLWYVRTLIELGALDRLDMKRYKIVTIIDDQTLEVEEITKCFDQRAHDRLENILTGCIFLVVAAIIAAWWIFGT